MWIRGKCPLQVTPEEWEHRMGFVPHLLGAGLAVPTVLPRRGQVEFIRLVRSDRAVKLLGVRISVPEAFVHRYLTATLHVRSQRMVIVCEDKCLQVPFPLAP